MKWLNNITSKGGTIEKVTNLAGKAIVDKDKRNEFLFNISLIIAQSQVAKYVRAVLAVLTSVSCLFFADKLTIDSETQKYLLYLIFGFYFLDYMRSMVTKK